VGGVPDEIPFEQLHQEWGCPTCGATKDLFEKISSIVHNSAHAARQERASFEINLSLLTNGKPGPHFIRLLAIFWKHFLASFCFFLRIKTVRNHL